MYQEIWIQEVLLDSILHHYQPDAHIVERVSCLTDNSNLEKKIEATRKEMYTRFENDPDDPLILAVSQKLDKLLNELTKVQKN